MDTVDKETRSRVMAAVHSNGTRLEQRLIALLRDAEITNFVCNEKSLPGKPDIAFMNEKVAIFLDSCFWHGCPKHLRRPSSNDTYWRAKIDNNAKRDLRNRAKLRRMGWSALRIWEHDLEKAALIIKKIHRALDQSVAKSEVKPNQITSANLPHSVE